MSIMLQKLLLWNFCLWGGICLAQPSIQWAKTYGGTKSDEAFDVLETADGGYLVIGEATSIDGNAFGNHGSSDILIIKQDHDGNIVWRKMLGGPDWDGATKVIPAVDGGYVIAGYSASVTGDVSGNHGDFDAWIIKIDQNGNILWQRCYGGSKREKAYNITPTKDNGYVFVGFSESSDGDVTMNHGFYDAWIVKIDSSGNLQWQRSYGGSNDEYTSSVIALADGGFMVCGDASSSDGNVSMNFGGPDFWLLRLNYDGKILWQKSYGGSSIDVGSGIVATNDQGYFLFGQTFSLDGQVSGNHGMSDLWLVRIDAEGEILWEKCYGGSDADYPGGALLKQGKLVLAGGASSIDGDLTGNDGGFSFWIFGVDQLGEIQWQNTYGGSKAEVCFSISETQDEGFVLAGYTWSNDGDVSGQHGTYNDYWIIKLSQNTSITSTAIPRSINLSPNPACTRISLSLPQEGIDYQGKICDVSGRELLRKKLNAGGGPVDWDVSTLPPGIYFIQLMDDEGMLFAGKIFKE